MAKANVYVYGGKSGAFKDITEKTFLKNGKYNIVQNIKDCDMLVLTGGEDINPALYGENPLPCTYYTGRDKYDLEALETAVDQSKFLVGICRGAQLLNVVPNGGKLWQDVDRHGSAIHVVFDCLTGSKKMINSVHHQQLRITEDAEMLAWAEMSTFKQSEDEIWKKPKGLNDVILDKDKDVEAVFYPKTRSFCFQAHPEFGHPPTTAYFFELMDHVYWKKAA